jgi:hypothetical protein
MKQGVENVLTVLIIGVLLTLSLLLSISIGAGNVTRTNIERMQQNEAILEACLVDNSAADCSNLIQLTNGDG